MKYGLTREQAKQELNKYGPNQLPAKQKTSAFKVLLKQFQNPLSFSLKSSLRFVLKPVFGERLEGSSLESGQALAMPWLR